MNEDEFDEIFDPADDDLLIAASNPFLNCEILESSPVITKTSNVPLVDDSLDADVSPCNQKNTFSRLLLNPSDSTCSTKITNTTVETSPNVSKCDFPNKVAKLNSSPWSSNGSSYLDSRFTPGFTPTAKKRKFPGPAGLFDCVNEEGKAASSPGESNKLVHIDSDFLSSSQFSTEHLTAPSWQKLQSDVSSNVNLLSTAKFYSIQRVLLESSKKKLPKHVVVPVLCVLLKELKDTGSTKTPIFMDDTGEVTGKIDSEVMSTYNSFITEGTAFILTKVTFLCNVLMLKTENLVSVYQSNGTEQHLQKLESILSAAEPLKPMKCECLQVKNINRLSNGSGTIFHHQAFCSNYISKMNGISASNAKECGKLTAQKEVIPPSNNKMRSDKFLEDLVADENCYDEFDVLLGSLDEKSFMEEF